MTIPAVQWKDVSFAVPRGFWRRATSLVRRIDIQVPVGETLGLIGANGAGKTTTLKLGCGLLRPASGEALIRGKSAFAAESRNSVGFVSEQQHIYPHLTLEEWLNFMAHLSGIPGHSSRDQIQRVTEQLSLETKCHSRMGTFSKGQLQRAGIAQALMGEPEILFLDEPMSGLDPLWRSRVLNLLLDYQKSGRTLIFSSHILSDVFRLSNRVVMIRNGEIQWQGGVKDLMAQRNQYQVVFQSFPQPLMEQIPDFQVEAMPDGSWTGIVDAEHKTRLCRLALEHTLELESMTPLPVELERLNQ